MKIQLLASLVGVYTFMSCNTPAKTAEDAKAPESAISTELLETYWKVVEINGQAVVNPPANQKEAHIILKKEGNRLQGSGGCNTLMGTYELMEGNRIRFSGVASTMMACPDMAIESQLGKAIEMADNYAINGKYLMLHKARMAPLVKLEAQ
ncbi:MAG TPA: META domain-containing protein [Saprospiraceae bacterium]|nr:META domain-containing protein [Saprospiraceae bacterium]